VGDAANILARFAGAPAQQQRPCMADARGRNFGPPTGCLFRPAPINRFTRSISVDPREILPPDTIVTTDVGQHQMWIAQAYPFANPAPC